MQEVREDGWEDLFDVIFSFCMKYDILIPSMDELHILRGRSKRRVSEHKRSHHFHVEIFYKVIDRQLQELNSHFNEVNTDLLLDVASLNSIDKFSNFNLKMILKLTELYPNNFGECMVELQIKLQNFIVDVSCCDDRFFELKRT